MCEISADLPSASDPVLMFGAMSLASILLRQSLSLLHSVWHGADQPPKASGHIIFSVWKEFVAMFAVRKTNSILENNCLIKYKITVKPSRNQSVQMKIQSATQSPNSGKLPTLNVEHWNCTCSWLLRTIMMWGWSWMPLYLEITVFYLYTWWAGAYKTIHHGKMWGCWRTLSKRAMMNRVGNFCIVTDHHQPQLRSKYLGLQSDPCRMLWLPQVKRVMMNFNRITVLCCQRPVTKYFSFGEGRYVLYKVNLCDLTFLVTDRSI